jgi:hypothetical protein
MKLSEYRNSKKEYTAKASEIIRQITLGGIAVVWLFKDNSNGKAVIDIFLLYPLVFLCLSLVSDLLQYVIGGEIWRIFYRKEEKKFNSERKQNLVEVIEPDVKAPTIYSSIIYWFYWSKITFTFLAYIFIIVFLVGKLSFK